MRRGLPLLTLLLGLHIGCGPGEQEQPEAIYQDARRQYRLANTEKALADLDRALARRKPGSGSDWDWRLLFLRAQILADTGRGEESIAILETAAPPEGAATRAEHMMGLGHARLRLGEVETARRLLDEAYRMAVKTGTPGLLAEIQNRRGAALTLLGDREAGEASFRDALEKAGNSGDAFLEISALGNLGFSRLKASRYDEAIPVYEKILPLSEKEGYRITTAKMLHNIGICYYRLGDYAKAFGYLTKAESVFRAAGDLPGLRDCLADTGNIHYARRDFSAAASCYRDAVKLARRTRDDRAAGAWLGNLASVAVESGDPDGAERYNREAARLAQKTGDREGEVYAGLNAARVAAARGDARRAQQLFQDVIQRGAEIGLAPAVIEARARLGSFHAKNREWPEAEMQFRRLADAIDANRARLRRDEWKLTYQSSVIPFYQDYVDLLMEQGRTEEALEAAESCRARVLAEKLGLDRTGPDAPVAADFRAKAKAAGAVLLSYWVAPRRSFLWVIAPGGISAFVLPPETVIRNLVEAYNNSILNLEDTRETVNPAGGRLYTRLVAPANELLPKGSRVIVVPDGPLFELNFETVLVASDVPRYWIEDVTVATAPSLAALRPAPARRGLAGESLLLIGNPVSPAPEYPPLPETAGEIRAIRSAFPPRAVTAFTQDGAEPGVYRKAGAGSFGFIHFSAHAQANRENPLDSAVILSRSGNSYKLYAREVAEIPLRARLVTISACRGASARLYSGEGLVGFAWAFLGAGANNVIAGLWDVNDRSTAVLMSRVYAEMAAGAPPASALRAAKLALLAEASFRRPYYWAPFGLFTRSAPFR